MRNRSKNKNEKNRKLLFVIIYKMKLQIIAHRITFALIRYAIYTPIPR